MRGLTATIQRVSVLTLELNCCNINRYDGGYQSVGYHKDDEELFRCKEGADILSISIGASSEFCIKKDVAGKISKIVLHEGKTYRSWGYSSPNRP